MITHPIDFCCIITNNRPCIVYEHLIWLQITGCFFKLGLLVLNRVNNDRALFEVSFPTKIQSTPRPGIGKSLTLTGYSSVLSYFTWIRSIYNYIDILPTAIFLPLLLLHCSVLTDYKMQKQFMVLFSGSLFCDRCRCR